MRLKSNREKFMKILLIIHHHLTPNSGAPGSTLELGKQYQKLGHEVQYYSYDDLPSRMHGKIKKIVFPWFVAAHIANLAGNNLIDVVDAANCDAWVWAKIFRNSKRKTPLLIARSHGLLHTMHFQLLEEAKLGNINMSWKYHLYNGSLRLWEEAVSMSHADLVFQLNQYDFEYAVTELDVKRERSHIVTNGIPDTFLNLPFHPTPTSENSTIGIALVASYISRKGINYSVPALNAILTSYPQVKVSFLGTGVSAEKVLADFEPAVRDRVRVILRYPHQMLPILLKDHQIKLFPSLSEGFSLALVEAMACGLTPIATATPGSMEIVKNEKNGILIPVRNSQAIEQALKKLIIDRSTLENLRCHAYATAQNYSWQNIAQDQLSLYQDALYEQNSKFQQSQTI
ncbi:MAG: hypothetical protein RLZZ04_900 [Cyanobacteriota bacterium]|jgi:glycosyltransferase involved in cell wall biosynthesis